MEFKYIILVQPFSSARVIMVVGTTQAASLLDISCQRLRQLLKQGRIRGAEKVGRSWQIPVFNGMPRVKRLKKKKGPPPTWRTKLPNSEKILHVNQNQLKHNRKYKTTDPVIILRQGTRTTYCHEADINGPCRLVYRPQQALKCGATLWIEIEPNVGVITKNFAEMAVT